MVGGFRLFFTNASTLPGKIEMSHALFVPVSVKKLFAPIGQMLPLQIGYRHDVDLTDVRIPPRLVVSQGMFSVVASASLNCVLGRDNELSVQRPALLTGPWKHRNT